MNAFVNLGRLGDFEMLGPPSTLRGGFPTFCLRVPSRPFPFEDSKRARVCSSKTFRKQHHDPWKVTRVGHGHFISLGFENIATLGTVTRVKNGHFISLGF